MMIRRGDIVLILALAALDAAAFLHVYGEGPGASARIYGPQGEVAQVSLDHDHQVHVAGALGESVVEVGGGRVRFLRSPCRRKLCLHGGWVDQAGARLACLPNRVAIRVEAAVHAFDSLNY